MSKYIDSEKLIAEIDSILSACTKQTHTGVYNTCHRIKGIVTSLQQEQPEVELFEYPKTPIKDAVEVTSRMKYIDEELKPIAEFIMSYASWNLHKDEWNQPVIEVPLFRVLDALVQRGKPYCGC